MNNKGYRNIRTIAWYVSIVVLLIFPLRHIHLGVDLWDGGYNYANFYYNSLEYMDSMWYFATWGANALGNLLMRLPFGGAMLGMNIYTGLLVGSIAAIAYVFCTRQLRIPACLAFTGEILALSLCWVPTAVLYNYLTYGLFLVGSILLYQGLVKEESKYLILAGIALGLNVSVRFSNLVQMGLILAVWYYGFVCKKKFVKILQDSGFCVLGYVGALAVFLLFISVTYGWNQYFDSVLRLFEMTEHAVDYAPGSMLTALLEGLTDNDVTYWVKRLGLAGVISLVVCGIFPGRYGGVKKTLTIGINMLIMLWMLKNGYCNTNYTTYQAIHYPVYILLIMILALCVWNLFDRAFSREEKLICVLLPLTIYISSLGGNTAIYSTINNLFLVLPCFLWLVSKMIREKKQLLYFPIKTALVICLVVAMYQGVYFGLTYVYEEGRGGMNMVAESREIPELQSIHSEEERIEQLNGLYRYIQENNLGDSKCILYGNIPGVAYYMKLPPALNIWADLRSYGVERMEADLERVTAEIAAGEDKPLVILEADYASYLETGETEMSFDHESTNEKFLLIKKFMADNGYAEKFFNDKFTLYK